jgi:hypothetical protein
VNVEFKITDLMGKVIHVKTVAASDSRSQQIDITDQQQ